MRTYVIPATLTLVLTAGCGRTPDAPDPPVETPAAAAAPAVIHPALLDDAGRPFDLWADRNAIATVLIFTRTDCPIANRYAPTVQALCDAYQDRGVEFFLVYVDPRISPVEIRRHLKEYRYSCRGVADPLQQLAETTGATVTPEAVVFDSRRNLAYRGRIDDWFVDFGEARQKPTTRDLADGIDAVLAGRAVAQPLTKAVGCFIDDLRR